MKTFTILVICLIAVSAFADIGKGDVLLGGSLRFNTSESQDEFYSSGTPLDRTSSGKSVIVNPQTGIFVSNSIEIGLGLKYIYNERKYIEYDKDKKASYTYKSNTHTLTVLPYISKHFKFNDRFTLL